MQCHISTRHSSELLAGRQARLTRLLGCPGQTLTETHLLLCLQTGTGHRGGNVTQQVALNKKEHQRCVTRLELPWAYFGWQSSAVMPAGMFTYAAAGKEDSSVVQ
jgi:hypothetical protein